MLRAGTDLARGFRLVRHDRNNADWKVDDPKHLAGVLQENPNFGALGAISPDIFFFCATPATTTAYLRQPFWSQSAILFVVSAMRSLQIISKPEHSMGPMSIRHDAGPDGHQQRQLGGVE